MKNIISSFIFIFLIFPFPASLMAYSPAVKVPCENKQGQIFNDFETCQEMGSYHPIITSDFERRSKFLEKTSKVIRGLTRKISSNVIYILITLFAAASFLAFLYFSIVKIVRRMM